MYSKLLQDYEKCYSILKKTIQEENIIKIKEIKQKEQLIQQSALQLSQVKQVKANNQISLDEVKLIQSFKQDLTRAMAFNNSGNIMVSGCLNNLNVWKFQNDTLSELSILTGHTNHVLCILFSQKSNWFVSGSQDRTIKCWRENNEQWICTSTASKHTSYVICLIMNINENYVISCSYDKTIIIWKVDTYKLEYNYTLDKHNDYVLTMKYFILYN